MMMFASLPNSEMMLASSSSSAMHSIQRRDLNKFRSLLDSYIDAVNPSRCNTFAGDIYKLLGGMPKRLFVACVDEMLQRAFNANPDIVPSYVKLLDQIKNVSIRIESGQYFPISQAISGYCMKHPDAESMEDVAKFRRKLPLINELYKLNLIQRGFFKFFAKMFANLRRGEVGIAFLYEILNNVNCLIENGSFYPVDKTSSSSSLSTTTTTIIPEADVDFFAECNLVLAEACRKNIVTNSVLTANILRLVESIKKKTKFTDVAYPRGELISPIDDPAIIKISLSTGQNAKISPTCKNGSKIVVNPTPLPNGAEQDQPTAVIPAINIQPLLGPPQQFSEIRIAMQSLARHPEQFSAHAAHIQHLLEGYCASSKDAFVGAIDELLNEALNADARTFASYMLLLEHLIKTLPPVPLRKAVVQSAMQIHRLETVEHVVEFCSSFRLSNELCRVGLLQSHVFKHYVNELAKPERDLSYLFTYEVMRNVDRLVDSGVAKLSGLEVAFWESCGERLAKASSNRRLVSADKEKEILQFMSEINQKGGWSRQVTQIGQKVELPVPVIRTSPEPVLQNNQPSPVVVLPPKPTSPQPANMMEDAEFRSLIGLISQINAANLESTARLFKPKLQAVSTQFFTEAVEIILAKIFLQIDDEQMLEDSAKLCIAFYRQDYGCGKNFTLELQKACLKYLSAKCQTEALERARARLQADTGASKQIAIPQEIGQLESLFRRKNIGCIKLVAKLFELKHLNFTFLLSLADSLLARKSEEALECLSVLFKRIGHDFVAQVLAKAMIEWWANFCDELADIARSSSSTPAMKTLASEILQSKENEWTSVEAKQQTSKQRLQSLLSEVTCELLAKSQNDYLAAADRVRQFAVSEITANVGNVPTFVDAFLAKIQDCFSFQQQQQRSRQSSPPTTTVLYANGIAVKQASPPTTQPVAVKLPDAAPKPRKPTRWDQPPPLVAAPSNILLKPPSTSLPPAPPPSPTNLQQLIKSLGVAGEQQPQKSVAPPIGSSFRPQQQMTNAFDAISAAALNMPSSLQSPNALASAMHKMWPGMQVLKGAGFNNSNIQNVSQQQKQQASSFFQQIPTTGHWQKYQPQTPPILSTDLQQVFNGGINKNFAGTTSTKLEPINTTLGHRTSFNNSNFSHHHHHHQNQPVQMPLMVKNANNLITAEPADNRRPICSGRGGPSSSSAVGITDAFGSLSIGNHCYQLRRDSSSGSSTVSIESPKGGDVSLLLSEAVQVGDLTQQQQTNNDENAEPTLI